MKHTKLARVARTGLSLALVFALSVSAAVAAEVVELMVGGEGRIKLVSDSVEVVVSPSAGGRVVGFIDKKTGESLTEGVSATEAPGGSGLFADRIMPERGGVIRSLEISPYEVVSTHADAESAFVTLRRAQAPLAIEKRIEVREGRRSVEAHYSITNTEDADFVGSFWSCNLLTPETEKEWSIRLPDGFMSDKMVDSGPVSANRISYSLENPVGGNYFVNAPEHDYMLISGGRLRAALVLPFDRLERVYSYHPAVTSQSLRAPSLEWFTSPFYLPPLAKGEAEAVNHPELEDPLRDYVYNFSIAATIFEVDGVDTENYRPKSTVAKLDRYLPPALEMPLFTDFSREALRWRDGGEPVSLLAVVKSLSSTEMFEFARRFPLDLRIVEVSNPHVFSVDKYKDWAVPDPAESLETELENKPRVILLSGIFESVVPRNLTEKILELVEAGTPLIYVSRNNRFPSLLNGDTRYAAPEEIFDLVPFHKLPSGAPEVEIIERGAGKVYWVKINLERNGRPYTQATALTPWLTYSYDEVFPYWEYYFSFYGRLLRLAVGEEPAMRLVDMRAEEGGLKLQMSSTRKGAARIAVRMDGPAKANLAELDWEGTVEEGVNTVALPFPADGMILNGDYFFNARIALDGAGQDWGSAVSRVRGARGIEELTLDKYAHKGERPEVAGVVDIRGAAELTLELVDSDGRVLAREVRPAAVGAQRFALVPESVPFLPLVKAVATLKADGVEVDRRSATLTMEPSEGADLNFIIWRHADNAWFYREFEEAHRDMGFTVGIGGIRAIDSDIARADAENVMRYGMRYAPMSMHRISSRVEDVVREPCLRDPDYLRQMREDVGDTVAKVSDLLPFCYYIGDENSLGHYDSAHDYCQSPFCLRLFREELERKHGDLAALNLHWRSAFASWDDVRPPTLTEARRSGYMAPWVEHRVFMMNAVSDTIGAMKKELVRLHDGAKLGFSGQLNTNINGAFNWSEILRSMDSPIGYARTVDGLLDLVRSQLRPGAAAGAWIGYGVPLPEIRWNYWRQIANGWFSPSYWYSHYFIRRGDRRLSEAGEHLRNVFTEIRESGVDPMLTGGEVETSPFTVVYSIPSLVASVATGERSVFHPGNYTANFNGWTALIRDLGYQPPQVMTCDELETADLSERKILVLAMTQMLSEAAVEALRKYVEEGGALIMDAQAGMLNEFALPRGSNPLAAAAGVSFEAAASSGAEGSLLYGDNALRLMQTGGRTRLAGGTALARIGDREHRLEMDGMIVAGAGTVREPAFVWSGMGKGCAAYLNCLLADYANIRNHPAAAGPVLAVMRELIGVLRPDLPKAHEIPSDCDALTYHGHGNRYMAIVRHVGDGENGGVLNFAETTHVYDTVSHRYLGVSSSMPIDLPPYAVRTLALLPRELGRMRGAAEWEDGRFRIDLERPVDSPAGVVRLEVECNGERKSCYGRNHILEDRLSLEVDPGLAPESGAWRIKVTDLFDGTVIDREFQID